jgi:hypothetical protein
MRFYNRIGKDFNTDVYMGFFGPTEPIDHGRVKLPTQPEINLIIRRYIENGWATRENGNVILTNKGHLALLKYEKEQHLKNMKKRENRYEEHAEYLKTVKRVHRPDGKYKKIKI